jgi:iron(III) transport system substrate-binding protein
LTVVERAFEERSPDVDVRWLDMGSQEVYDRIRSERANAQADIWYGGPATILARGAREGLMEPYRPSWAEVLDPSMRGPDDLYHAIYRTPPILVYNPVALSREEAPADWDDLLDPRWKGRIIVRDPLASGTMRTIFGMIVARSVTETGSAERGFEWLLRLDAQTKEYVHSPALLHEKIIRQEGVVTLWELTDILNLMAGGAPLDYRFPTSGTPVIADSVALVRGARNREVATRFLDWIGGPEALSLAAEQAFRLPARSDLPLESLPEWVAEVRAELVPADVDWELMEERTAEWMSRWDRTVRGRGGRE